MCCGSFRWCMRVSCCASDLFHLCWLMRVGLLALSIDSRGLSYGYRVVLCRSLVVFRVGADDICIVS